MHLLNPKVCMMWDGKIIRRYRLETTPDSYIQFMRLMQKMWKEGKFPEPSGREIVPRAIDIYNINID